MKQRKKLFVILATVLMLTAIMAAFAIGAAAADAARVTPYGNIPDTANLNTFAVFAKGANEQSYTFIGCWGQYKTAVGFARDQINYSTGSYKGGTAVVYMRADYNTSSCGSNFNEADVMDGTLIVDLGGKTLTAGKNRVIGFLANNNQSHTYTTSAIYKNGTINAISNPIGEMWAEGAKYSGEKTVSLSFENVNFTASDPSKTLSLFNVRGSYYNATQTARFDLSFTDCNFNYGSQAKVNLFTDSTNQYAVCNVTVNGGSISAKSLDTFNLITASGAEDKISFGKGADGNMTQFTMNYTSAIPTVAFATAEGNMYLASESVSEGGTNVYSLSNVKRGDYGYLPLGDTDEPFSVFLGEFHIGSFDTYYKALDYIKQKSYAKNGTYKGRELVLYMSKDYDHSDSTYANLAQIGAKVIFDMGGNTLTQTHNYILDLTGKATDGIINQVDFEIKNGTILTNAASIMRVSSPYDTGSFIYNGTKVFNITYDNVSFDKAPDSGSYVAILTVQDINEADGNKHIELNSTFNNCSFNSYNSMLFNAALSDKVDVNVAINGGHMTSENMTEYGFMRASDSDDTLVFGKTDGGDYMTLTMAKGATAPALTFNGGTLEFVKTAETEDGADFRLVAAGINAYIPKVSITLDSSIVMNVYVPVDLTVGFNFDGDSYTDLAEIASLIETLEDGKQYYRVTRELAASSAARELILTVTVNRGEDVLNGRFTFSVPRYAEKVLASESELEKQIARDVLSYVRAASIFFDPADTATVAAIDAIIGARYDETAPHIIEGSAEVSTPGFKAATFALNSTPALRFYIADGADENTEYRFYINGIEYSYNEGSDSYGDYVELDVYAYAMCETIDYTVNGLRGSFHIAGYHAWSLGENDEALVNLVERFWRYCQSARDYKNGVTIQVSYVDESGNELAQPYTVRHTAGKDFKIKSPAVEGYYTRDLYLTVSANENKSITVTYKEIPASVDSETVKSYLPDITAWGDSITAGAYAYTVNTAEGYLIDLVSLGSTYGGGTYSEVLRNLIAANLYGGIEVVNCGVGGESTATIAARANTESYYLYLREEVTVSDSPVVISLGQTAPESTPSKRIGILRKDIKDYISNVTVVAKNSLGEDVEILSGNLVCEVLDGANGEIWGCDYGYLQYTFTRTDGGTDPVTLPKDARVVTKSAVMFDGNICIVFMGENGGFDNDFDELIKQQTEILVACGIDPVKDTDKYLIISSTSGSNESREAITKALSAKWGANYINMGNELNSRRAHELAGYSEKDIISVENNVLDGTVSPLLLQDGCHPHAVGYAVIANVIFERLFDIGAFDALFTYYESLEN